MYIIKVKVGDSKLHGKGVFTLEPIAKGEVVWVFREGYDNRKTSEEFQEMDDDDKEHLSHTAYFSAWSKMWVYPPYGDAAEYTNHSKENNLGVTYNKNISSEPVFIANRDIEVGEELTNNYHEFDEVTKTYKPEWSL